MRFATPDIESKAAPAKSSWSPQALLRSGDFQTISRIVYDYSGIRLNHGKEELVRSRLMKRLHSLGIGSFSKYIRYVQEDKTARELRTLVDCLTTNKTSFFRERQHFDYLGTHILPELRKKGPDLRIWSAGCSSGEEPYSIAMLLHERWPGMGAADVRILATDISERMLAKARSAEYGKEELQHLPPAYRWEYFITEGAGSGKTCKVQDRIRSLVRFARLNLMDEWPMTGPFHIVFCSNVMIYFDTPTQRKLVQRFYRLLTPGGYLLIGHSESLLANAGGFRYVRPATYIRSLSE